MITLEFMSKNEELLGSIQAEETSAMPQAGDWAQVPDAGEGASHIHFLKIERRDFIYDWTKDETPLTKIVFLCQEKQPD